MGIFSRKNKKEKDDSFKEKAYISGGDLFDIEKKIESQINRDINDLENKLSKKDNGKDIYNPLTTAINNKFSQYKIDSYYLFMVYVDYFTNLIDYLISDNDYNLLTIIKSLVKLAFLNGKSLLYYDKQNNMFIPLEIIDIHYNPDLTIKEVEVSYLNDKDWTKAENKRFSFFINYSEKENIFIFHWMHDFSAWIYFYPFVKLNSALLNMVNINAFLDPKKMAINVNNKNQIIDDYMALFDENLGVIVNPTGSSLGNDIEILKISESKVKDNFVDMYSQIIQTYYKLFGIRNFQVKSSRAVVDEVYNSDGMVTNLEMNIENEYRSCFKWISAIFTKYKLGIFEYKINGTFTNYNLYKKLKSEKDAEIDLAKIKTKVIEYE